MNSRYLETLKIRLRKLRDKKRNDNEKIKKQIDILVRQIKILERNKKSSR